MKKNVYLFAGPSMNDFKTSIKLSSITLLPPAKRHDIKSLVEAADSRGVILLADGNFHNVLSVGHQEIRQAIEDGWEVWGLSSMGAIRAAEMKDFGMKGFGFVYNLFLTDSSYTDDEVALLHSPNYPFSPISEPLVNIRYFLSKSQLCRSLSPKIKSQIINHFQNVWYGYRNLRVLKSCLLTYGLNEIEINEQLTSFAPYRIKNIDLNNFLNVKPWLENKK